MKHLQNLEKIGQLKRESSDPLEIENLLTSADTKLKDSDLPGLSKISQFEIAYTAAFNNSLAALRWHGYRADNRYIVFSCLPHTLKINSVKTAILANCHNKRNLAQYEGSYEVEGTLLVSLKEIILELEAATDALMK